MKGLVRTKPSVLFENVAELRRSIKELSDVWVESSGAEEILGEDAFKQGRIDAIDADEEITLLIIDVAQVSAAGDIVSTDRAATTVSAATITTPTTVDNITLAQALLLIF
ncbi:hypothetical protein Tco_0505781 [Tanacetum coccineum]